MRFYWISSRPLDRLKSTHSLRYPLFFEEIHLASVLDQPSDRACRKTLRTGADPQHLPAIINQSRTAPASHHGNFSNIRLIRLTDIVDPSPDSVVSKAATTTSV